MSTLPPAQILRISPDEYHARPGFSSTIAKTLISQSPLHAKTRQGKKPTKLMDRGTVIHKLLLGKGKEFAVVQHADWRTKDAQKQRDEAREQGLVPVLAHDIEEYGLAAESLRVQLADRGIVLDGESEFAIEWYEPSPHGPVLCRCMIDHIWLAEGRALDLKITGDAAPSAVERSSENFGYAIQEVAYTRAMIALEPRLAGRTDFLFAFCEAEDPYGINLTRGDGMFRELGERRWLRAVATWAECLATNTWPGYGRGVNPLSPPAWALAREEAAA